MIGGLDVLDEPRSASRLRAKLLHVAWLRYRIPSAEADDLVQSAFTTYLEVRHRYANVVEHGAILTGIFRKKCLKHIDRSVRDRKRFERYCTSPDAARENPWIRPDHPGETPSVLEDIVRRESDEDIQDAIAHLRPISRELVGEMASSGFARKELMARLHLNQNTLDSRLHACRSQLRVLLRKQELAG